MRRRYWNYCGSVNETEANNIYWGSDYDDGGYWNTVKKIGPRSCDEAKCR